MRELTELEYLELFTCAREIAAKFSQYYQVPSFQFVMHDGELARDESLLGGLCLQAIPAVSGKLDGAMQSSGVF